MREDQKKAMARRLRKKLTSAEALLWWRLRREEFDGWRFRRQHPIGPYIADFACIEVQLVIEVDGATHRTPEELAHDESRTRYLESNGWRVMRFPNDDVIRNRRGVQDMIVAALNEQLERRKQSTGR
jgi:very-short-patch-repair endonuclease